jgi:5-amino-6-(5-phospho-D-ribitylamino)uracil phosphatase
MQRYKAIVSDFDGTLVSGSLSLTEPVIAAIKQFVKAGGIFSIATGRDYYGAIKDICLDLGIESLHIVRGGSEIVSSITHEVVWGRYIDQTVLQELLSFLHTQDNIYFVAERGELIYTKQGVPHQMFGTKAKFGVLENISYDNVPKVFLPASKNDPQVVIELLNKLEKMFPQLHLIKTAHKEFIGMDINDGGVSKHLALLEYSKLMNLDPKEIIGVGDSYNDYPLLSACGFKVAMGNAPEELTEIADMVVGTQAEDGIIEVLNFVR